MANEARPQTPTPFRLRLQTNKPAYVLGEPVEIAVTIDYTGTVPLTVTHPLDSGDYSEKIEVAEMGASDFYHFLTPEEASDALRDRGGAKRTIVFKPGVEVTRSNVLVCWSRNFKPLGKTDLLFPTTGTYIVRFTIGMSGSVVQGQTTVTFTEAEAQTDRDAYGWLQRSGLVCYLQYLRAYGSDTNRLTREVSKFRELTDKYPDSVFADFIRRTVAASFNAATNLAIQVPETEIARTAKELEAQWYDVKGFNRNYPDGNKEYLKILLPLHDDLAGGRLTETEFDRRRAETFRYHITNYSRPLAPEEWRRRYDGYAREDAERSRQQDIDLQRYAVEADRILRDRPKQQPK